MCWNEDISLFATDSDFVIVVANIAHKFWAEYLWQRYLNFIVPKYFFKSIYNQYRENCTHDFFHLCSRAIGNLALKKIWVLHIEAKAIYMDTEREKEAELFEVLWGNHEIWSIVRKTHPLNYVVLLQKF